MLKMALLAGAVAAVAVPGTAAAARGVVVKVDGAAGLVAVAAPRGTVSLVHTARAAKLQVGERVSYRPKRLRNETFAADRVHVLGKARRTHVRGLVLAHRAGGYVLSAHGAVLTIRSAARTTASATSGTPQVGTEVDVTADVSSGSDLQQTSVSSLGAAQAGAIDGRIQALAAGAITVANDGVQVQMTVPAGLDLSKFAVGDEVLAYFSRQTDGSLLLTAISANGDTAQANDAQQSQGNTTQANQEVEQEDQGDGGQGAQGGEGAGNSTDETSTGDASSADDGSSSTTGQQSGDAQGTSGDSQPGSTGSQSGDGSSSSGSDSGGSD